MNLLRYNAVLVLVSPAVLFLASCASAPVEKPATPPIPPAIVASKSLVERLRFGVDARLKVGLGYGYSAAVREGGKTTTFAAGRRTLEPVRPLSTRDLLEIGSVTKTFTGILLHLAEVENRLSVDQKLEEFFPALQGAEIGKATLRELGTHVSGLPSTPEGLKIRDEANPWRDLKREEILAALATFKRPPLAEGESKRPSRYSNWGFVVLGIILEQVYAKPYPAILATHVLNPLRMSASGVDRRTRAAPGFSLNTDPVPAWDFASFAAAAGGLESNAADMARFLEALENPPRGRLGEAIRATFLSGIGWDSAAGNQRPLWKNGMTGGHASFLAFYPDSKAGLFVATNTKIAPDTLADFATGVTPVDGLLARVSGARTASDEEVARLKGKYRNPIPARDPRLPLAALEIFESVGRLVGRYDFGFLKQGAILAPGDEIGLWNVIDGSVNLDVVEILDNGLRATVITGSGYQATFELEKIPADVQKFPALEK